MKAQELIDQLINEKLSNGMKRGFAKRTQEAKTVCKECGMPVPKYEGRYPKKCTECGAELEYECKKK